MKKAITPEEMTASNALASNDKSTSQAAQVRRVLDYLQTNAGGLNRYEAERLLNVCHLAARIVSIKEMGYAILTTKERAPDPYGQSHPNIARYFLTGGTTSKQEAA